MPLRSFVFAVSLAAASQAMAQNVSLAAELDDIERQMTEIEERAARYDSGLILTLIDARREALLLARTLIENRINAEAGGASIEVTVPAIQPDEDLAQKILDEMAAVQQRIEEVEREAATAGGLIQALTLSRAETERLTLAQLQMGYVQAKYGIAFPVMAPLAAVSAPTSAPAAGAATLHRKALPRQSHGQTLGSQQSTIHLPRSSRLVGTDTRSRVGGQLKHHGRS